MKPTAMLTAILLTILLLPACPGGSGSGKAPDVDLDRLSADVAYGPRLEGDADYELLADKGIRVVVAVGAARPDAEAAARHGLRPVHVPLRFGEIPPEFGLAIAKTVRELEGPFYFGAGDGKRRAATAAAMAQTTLGPTEESGKLLEPIGGFTPPAEGETRAFAFDFPATAEVSAIAGGMVSMDRAFADLGLVRSAVWAAPSNRPDLDPMNAAQSMHRALVEIMQTEEARSRPPEFLGLMRETVGAVQEIGSGLRQLSPPLGQLEPAWKRLQESCGNCHEKFRGR